MYSKTISVSTKRMLVKICEVGLNYRIELSLANRNDFPINGESIVLADGYYVPVWLDPTFVFYIPQDLKEVIPSIEDLKSLYGETPLDSLIEEAMCAVKSIIVWKDNWDANCSLIAY